MPDLSGDVGELSFKVQITRAETGKVEEFTLVWCFACLARWARLARRWLRWC